MKNNIESKNSAKHSLKWPVLLGIVLLILLLLGSFIWEILRYIIAYGHIMQGFNMGH